MKRLIVLTLCVALATLYVSCSGGDIRLDVTPSVVIHYYDDPESELMTVDAGAYFDFEYTWNVGPNFSAPQQPLRAFVHFRDSTGQLIEEDSGETVQDDHDFEKPVSEWEADKDVVYTRKRFKFDRALGSRNFIVNMHVGLYNPDTLERAELAVSGETPEDRAYKVATFRIQNNPRIYPRYNDTWHGPEPAPNEAHHWSRRNSVVTFIRDKDAPAAELWLSGHSPVEDIEADVQTLSLYIHDVQPEFLIFETELTGERFELTRIPIPTELYETYTDRDINIHFVVDKVLSTAGGDARGELGFLVHELLLQPRNLER